MPPAASGPVFTVRRPSLNGAAWATAGMGKRDNAVAVPAAALVSSVRRLILRGMVFSSVSATRIKRSEIRDRSRCRCRISRCSIRATERQPSALRQRRVVARIDWMREILGLRPGPELADVLVGVDGLVPELKPVFGALSADTPHVDVTDHIVEVVEFERAARRVS